MKYIFTEWLHKFEDEPNKLYYEINNERIPTRVIEIYKSGKIGFASNKFQFQGAFLSVEPLPELEEINSDSQFKSDYIDQEEFEKLWKEVITQPDWSK